MLVLGVPVMSNKAFIATECTLDKRWWEMLQVLMREAAEEKRRLGIEKKTTIIREYQPSL